MNYLTKKNNYFTPARSIPWIVRRYPGVAFYTRIIWIIVTASRLAKNGRYKDSDWIQSSLSTLRALESVGGRFELRNLGVIGTLTSPCVFISNHMSVLETFVLPCLIQPHRNVTFVIKESLIDYPFFKYVMRSRNPIVVGRTNPREDLKTVLKEGEIRLSKGISVIIFPQTTRSSGFDEEKFNSLGVKLARRAKVPVVPIALKTDAWGVGQRIKDGGKIQPSKTVYFTFGDPLQVQGSGKEEHKHIVDFIAGSMQAFIAKENARG